MFVRLSGKANKVVHFEEFDIEPQDPQLGQPLEIKATIKIDEPIVNGTVSSLSITKYVGLGLFSVPVKIPCISGFGSCSGSFCEAFTHPDSKICEFMKGLGRQCECPIQPGVFHTPEHMTVVLPNPSGLGKLLAKGPYRITWEWSGPDGTQLGCITADATLK
ncbi:ganglioside GM2 activator-like protein [Leptotrombidium deliense]|uniref:Ganglioside GM2 activator-like protein n=1 Tax=Leptotrombidium deliense TaxID=299467 RepID=A0A443S2M8_9ACAR|nr:ganglioside GM2 activator-like protein [Leptotrombidium deliense]